MLPRARSALHHCPQNRSEGLAAAAAVQELIPSLRRLSPEHVRWLARPYWRTGWTAADVAKAIERGPSGRQHGYTSDVHSPANWASSRLAQWLGVGGRPVVSPSQAAAEAHRLDVAEAARLRAARVNPGPEVAAAGAARARQAMRQALTRSRQVQ
jgi:hypothetical protein